MKKTEKQISKDISPLGIIRDKRNKALNRIYFYDLLQKIAVLALTIFLIFHFVFGFKVMENEDMHPKIVPTDLLIYYRLQGSYSQDDVVVVKKDKAQYVLRIVASPEDEISIDENGLLINGAYQSEPDIFYPTGYYKEGIKLPIKLENDEYFALGDLREGAKDSRYFGPIKRSEIEGKVFGLFRRTKF